MTKVFFANDHAGTEAKIELMSLLNEKYPHLTFVNLGTDGSESVHYPQFAEKLSCEVLKSKDSLGILICGSGIGVSMMANKFKGIRAALCQTVEEAKLAKEHNHANVLCFGARIINPNKMLEIIESWLVTEVGGDRHIIRVQMLNERGEDLK